MSENEANAYALADQFTSYQESALILSLIHI